MPARGVNKALYVSDILGQSFIRRVDDHLFTQAQLGWSAALGGELNTPRGLRPRHVIGVDATGRTHSVVVATLTATLWTRAVLTWDVLDDTGTLVSVTMTGQVGESVSF